MLGTGGWTLEAGGLHHGDAQHVLRLPREGDVVYLFVGNGLIGKDALVDESLQVGRLHTQALQGAESGVLLVADDAQEQMVRANSVAPRAHGFLPRVLDNRVEVFRYL